VENASKALLMAASVLVGILILSLIAYLYTIFGDYGSLIQARLESKKINEFNVQFTQYESYKDDNGNWQNTCKASDIVSLANLAKQNNQNYDFGTDSLAEKEKEGTFYITIDTSAINGERNFETLSTDAYIKFMKSEIGTMQDGTYQVKDYSCSILIDQYTKRVKKVIFKPV